MKSIIFPLVGPCCAAILSIIPIACGGSTPDVPPAKSTPTTTDSAQPDKTISKNDGATSPRAEPAAPTPSKETQGRPSAEEWAKGQAGNIERATELGCQVTQIREWVRIACGPKTAKGARIVDIAVFLECENSSCTTHPERAYMQRGQRILEVPLLEGYEIKASFVWEDRAEDLRLRWPKGAAKPTKLGEFTTDPDIAAATLRPQLRAMDCCLEIQGEGTCLGRAAGYADGPCFRSFQKDCKKLVACQMGELPPPCASSPEGCDN